MNENMHGSTMHPCQQTYGDEGFFFDEDKLMDQRRARNRIEYDPLPTFDPHAFSAGDWMSTMREDRLGMRVTSGSVTITKDKSNLIGISIGGGAPFCPCIYVVQVFDNMPAGMEGTLESGDEIVAVNGVSVKGKTKVEVAKMIQSTSGQSVIIYNKLHADVKEGKSLDISMKKMKHRLVDNMSSATADALGLSRAILCNDNLVKRLNELEGIEFMYQGISQYVRQLAKAFVDLCHMYKEFGEIFSTIGVREPQPEASLTFSKFGEMHRSIERKGIEMLKSIKIMMGDMNTFISKAVPDTRLTIKKYADVKFEYLSYCLKIKEMDDEEYAYQAMQDPLYRVETGNYEYRLILRCRQEAKKRFASLRADVLVKLELLDQKHVSDMIQHLQRLLSAMAKMNSESLEILKANQLFPLDVDLSGNQTFNYPDPNSSPYQDQEEEEDDEDGDDEDVDEEEDVHGVGQTTAKVDRHMIAKEAILDLEPVSAATAASNANSNHNKSSNLHDLLSLE